MLAAYRRSTAALADRASQCLRVVVSPSVRVSGNTPHVPYVSPVRSLPRIQALSTPPAARHRRRPLRVSAHRRPGLQDPRSPSPSTSPGHRPLQNGCSTPASHPAGEEADVSSDRRRPGVPSLWIRHTQDRRRPSFPREPLQDTGVTPSRIGVSCGQIVGDLPFLPQQVTFPASVAAICRAIVWQMEVPF